MLMGVEKRQKMGSDTHWNMKNADFCLDLNNILVEKFACTRNELIATKTEKKMFISFHPNGKHIFTSN